MLTISAVCFAQKGLSHVRVVRLSYVSGTVAVKRPASTEWAKALVNTPVQEGFEISTSAHSYAEVEFENGSTVRLGELSKVNFDQLAIDENGSKLNRVNFEQGYATFHILPEHHDAYSVKIAETTLTPSGKSEFRTDWDRGRARVEVFSGSVAIAAPAKNVKLGKDKVLQFDPSSAEVALNTTEGITKDTWDKWTSDRDTQTELALNDQAVGAHGPAYGWSDLDAYGEWGFFPGFGYGWSPFAAMGWSPYSMGMWSFYPGMGYTWIGGEPWGWLPYHYGNWNFMQGAGWFWTPGSMGAFSPALVSWYSGPGWLGWAPLGMGGLGMLNTVPGGLVQNGALLTPGNVSHVAASAGTPISRMPFEPGAGAMLSGPGLSAETNMSVARTEGAHVSAPSSLLMAGDSAKEQSLRTGRSFNQPLRVKMGTTLGGQYAVGGAVGEFRGDAFTGMQGKEMQGREGPAFSRGNGANGPAILPHGQRSSNSPQAPSYGAMQGAQNGAANAGSSMNSVSSASSHSASASPGGHH
jgi:hypothetical protein